MSGQQPELLPNLAMAAAAMVLEAHFPNAACVFVDGAVIRGEGGVDVDLVVACTHEAVGRQRLLAHAGFVFAVTSATPAVLLQCQDAAVLSAMARGRKVGRDMATALTLQARARAALPDAV